MQSQVLDFFRIRHPLLKGTDNAECHLILNAVQFGGICHGKNSDELLQALIINLLERDQCIGSECSIIHFAHQRGVSASVTCFASGRLPPPLNTVS